MSQAQFKNYGPTRPATAPRVYRPWPSAFAGFCIGYLTRTVLELAAGMLGLVVALGVGLAHAPAPSVGRLLAWVVVIDLTITAVAAVLVARYLSARGATRPVVAALGAGFGSWLVGWAPASIPWPVTFVVAAAVEIVVLALVTTPVGRVGGPKRT